MTRTLQGLAIATAVALTVATQPAAADTVAKELLGYQSATILLDKQHAADCNLQDSGQALLDRLHDGLAKLGLGKNSGSASAVVVQIANRSFGVLAAQCAIHTQMSFVSVLPKNMLTNLPARQQAAIDRLGQLPVTLWSSTSMAVTAQTQPSGGGKSTKAEETALSMIDSMVALLASQRK